MTEVRNLSAVAQAATRQGLTADRILLYTAALALMMMAMLHTMPAGAAGTETPAASSGTAYSVANVSKVMRDATKLVNAERFADALVQLEKETAANPKNADAWNLTGFSLRKLGDYKGSEAAYDRALAIDPNHKGALEYKGELYLTLGNLQGAEEMRARLEASCSFNCSELKALIKAIVKYKKDN